jgi:hypothetical protein
MDHRQQGVDRPEALDGFLESLDDRVVAWHQRQNVSLYLNARSEQKSDNPGQGGTDHNRSRMRAAESNQVKRQLPWQQPSTHASPSVNTARFCQK